MAQPARPPPETSGLVVDDDAVLLEFIHMALSEQGFHVVTAADGLQAVEAARLETPSLVLMDIGIPHLNGCELVDRLQETCLTEVPCVIMSRWSAESGGPGPPLRYRLPPEAIRSGRSV